jgi:hypothetical protein
VEFTTKTRRALRAVCIAALTGALTVTAAWAGAGLVPIGVGDDLDDEVTESAEEVASTLSGESSEASTGALTDFAPLEDGQILAGAHKISMEPRPEDYGGEWQTEGCETLGGDADQAHDHVHDFERTPWPASPNCIYMGGYGIGPMNAVSAWDDEYGLWVRSIAMSDGSETVVMTIIDAVYYMGRYANLCDGCGAFDIAERLGTELGIDPSGFFIAATHSHTAPDLIGGWGGVPDWYMIQVEEAIEESIRVAVTSMRPAAIEIGEEFARAHNRERRNTYRSAEEPGLSWFRLVATGDSEEVDEPENGDKPPGRRVGPPGEDDPDPEPTAPEIIATVGAFAAHPTTVSAGAGVAHADWPGVFAARAEERFGGIGLHFMTGLGNVSASGGTMMGRALADLIPEPGAGQLVTDPTVRVASTTWDHPVTNSALTALALPGFFDRPFEAGPASISVGTHRARQCNSVSAVAVRTAVNAASIGPLVITGAPGETFSNLSNTIKEKNPNGVTFPLGMVNDALGYIIQSFESDHAARQALGFAAQDAGFEYEDAYSIDGCFGDAVLEETLSLLAEIGAGN